MLAQRGNMSMNAAFDRLRRYARNRNALLSEVARQVVGTDLAADVLGVAMHPAKRSTSGNLVSSHTRIGVVPVTDR